jgi:hypothetical protein
MVPACSDIPVFRKLPHMIITVHRFVIVYIYVVFNFDHVKIKVLSSEIEQMCSSIVVWMMSLNSCQFLLAVLVDGSLSQNLMDSAFLYW